MAKETKEITIAGVNFSMQYAKNVPKKRFDQIMSRFDKPIIDKKWKELCLFAGRKEKGSPKATPKNKNTEEQS